jgi:uncharacterized protein YyaL (SSP411 family)
MVARPYLVALAATAALALNGCSRCSQQPTTPLPPPDARTTGVKMSTSPHPGSIAHPPEVAAAIAEALVALPHDYRPRTRHYDGQDHPPKGDHDPPEAPAGSEPVYANRLLLENSPYLRQHAHNPVDWRPWGEAAFAEARRLNRPIFLSIGYATCHWCHVMEHESFEDVAIAQVLNSRYVPVKVDREERPDVDAVYMTAVQALTGSGGWPMSVWLVPDPVQSSGVAGLPYFAGTYFPPRDGVRGARSGFFTLLHKLADAHAQDPARVAQQGAQIANAIRGHLQASVAGEAPGTEATDRAVAEVASSYDRVHGGRRWAPKFPSQVPLSLLCRHHLRTGEEQSLEMALHSLRRMIMGGLYDHVGGGFHRYSTDARWFAPHFEKMLYDQGIIAAGALDVHAATGNPLVRKAIRETLAYLARELQQEPGGFSSATDADSEGREGKFFLWTVKELQEVLGADEGTFVARAYGATAQGTFEGSNILHLPVSLSETAQSEGMELQALSDRLRSELDRLLAARSQRVPPLTDDKVLPGWNALAIAALARASWQLQEPKWLTAAERAGDFILQNMLRDGRLYRSWRAGVAKGQGQLDDHAFLVQALLDLAEASGNSRWFEQALAIQAVQDAQFADGEHGGYFATPADGETLIARSKPDHDGAEPSGNSIAAMNLVRLHALTGDDRFRASADRLLGAFAVRLRDHPSVLSEMLLAVEARAWPMREVVLVRPAGGSDEAFLQALRDTFLPHRVLLRIEDGKADAWARLTPLVNGKVARNGQTTAYVCRQGVCQLPTTDPNTMIAQLKARVAQ